MEEAQPRMTGKLLKQFPFLLTTANTRLKPGENESDPAQLRPLPGFLMNCSDSTRILMNCFFSSNHSAAVSSLRCVPASKALSSTQRCAALSSTRLTSRANA